MSFVVLSLGLTVRPPLSSLAISSRHRLSTLTAAVPSTAAPSTAGFASNREALAAAPLFPRTWVPLASVFELNPDRPTPLRFLDQRYIAYCDNKGEWVVMDDACPHRLAPLSEGRIDREADRIECAYHGWAFESSGACVAIPQASDAVAKASLASPRACVASYPVVVEKSVLWTWPWPEDPLTVVGEPMAHPETMLAGVADDASTYTRDLPYGWDTLLENIVDPSHIPFAHHGLQGKRSDAIPINMSVPTNRADDGSKFGFAFDFGDRTMGKRRAGVGEFRAPFVRSDASPLSHCAHPSPAECPSPPLSRLRHAALFHPTPCRCTNARASWRTHGCSPHARAHARAPPDSTSGHHLRTAPPDSTSGHHLRTAPPDSISGLHLRTASPDYTSELHLRTAPPNCAGCRLQCRL